MPWHIFVWNGNSWLYLGPSETPDPADDVIEALKKRGFDIATFAW